MSFEFGNEKLDQNVRRLNAVVDRRAIRKLTKWRKDGTTIRPLVIALLASVPLTLCAVVAIGSTETVYATAALAPQQTASRLPDVIFVPTPPEVVDAMLKAAKVTSTDVVYDLGCGDGRILIAAAKEYGARGVGIDIDPQRIREATANAQQGGVADRVRFLEADLFETDISEASVVTLYLLPSLNLKLRPKLLRELQPGTRIVSHAFDMGDWKPEQELNVNGRRVYMWTVPKR